jgi:hypothetical protein
LTLTSPVGGETFSASSPMTITWDTTATSDGVYIQLYKPKALSHGRAASTSNRGPTTPYGCSTGLPGAGSPAKAGPLLSPAVSRSLRWL